MTDHHHGHGHAHSPDHRDWASHGQRLVDEGELRMPILLEALDAIAAHVGPRDTVGRILDIGSGPGVAAVALAQRFSEAQVTAVDLAEPLADQARARAAAFGVGDGVDATIADLEQSLTHLADAGSVDVVWASMVLHHLEALPAALREIAQLLRPDGLLAIVEFGTTPGPLPAGARVGTDGFVERHSNAVRAGLADHLPTGATLLDWPALLATADFDVVEHRELELHLPAPLDHAGRRSIHQMLEMTAGMANSHLDDADRAVLAALVDPDDPTCISHRDDLPLDISLTFVLGRRR
jgi:SAM-dependent methyltransferase